MVIELILDFFFPQNCDVFIASMLKETVYLSFFTMCFVRWQICRSTISCLITWGLGMCLPVVAPLTSKLSSPSTQNPANHFCFV